MGHVIGSGRYGRETYPQAPTPGGGGGACLAPLSTTLYVDAGTTTPLVDQNGSISCPYATITQAFANIALRSVGPPPVAVVLSPNLYVEDLVIPPGHFILMQSIGGLSVLIGTHTYTTPAFGGDLFLTSDGIDWIGSLTATAPIGTSGVLAFNETAITTGLGTGGAAFAPQIIATGWASTLDLIVVLRGTTIYTGAAGTGPLNGTIAASITGVGSGLVGVTTSTFKSITEIRGAFIDNSITITDGGGLWATVDWGPGPNTYTTAAGKPTGWDSYTLQSFVTQAGLLGPSTVITPISAIDASESPQPGTPQPSTSTDPFFGPLVASMRAGQVFQAEFLSPLAATGTENLTVDLQRTVNGVTPVGSILAALFVFNNGSLAGAPLDMGLLQNATYNAGEGILCVRVYTSGGGGDTMTTTSVTLRSVNKN